MKFKEMTEEEASKILESQKDDPESLGGFMNHILGDAGPNFKMVMEQHAAKMLAAGYNIGRVLTEAEKSKETREDMSARLYELAQKIKATSRTAQQNNSTEKEE
jgi:hypothetical protein